MKKFLIIILALIGLSFFFVSCANKNKATEPQTNTLNPTNRVSSVSPPTWEIPPVRSVNTKATPRGMDEMNLQVDQKKSLSVAQAFSALLFIQDARSDRSPSDAGKRAAKYADDALSAQLNLESPGRGDGDWNDLIAQDGFTTTTVKRNNQDGAPADTDFQRYVSCKVVVTSHPQEKTQSYVLYVELTKNLESQSWQVNKYTVTTN
jgi:hypothetical protein